MVVSSLLPPPDHAFDAAHGPPVLSPDGRTIAFLAAAPDEPTHLFVRPLDSSEARRLDDTAGAVAPFWSPDGRSLGFFADGKLKRIDLAENGRPLVLAEAPSPTGGSWSTSGKIVFVGDGWSPPSLVDAGGGPTRRLPAPYASLSGWYLWPHWLPDERRFLLTVQDLGGPNSGVLVASVDPTEDFRRLTRRVSNAVYIEPGRLLLWEDGALLERQFDAETQELGEVASRVVDGVAWGQYLSYGHFSAAPNGVLVYQPGPGAIGDTELVRVDREGRELAVLAPRGEYYHPRLSRDGRRVAVDLTDIQTTHGDLWIFEIGRGTRTRLTDDPLDESNPVWAPGDSEIVFMRVPDLYRRDTAAAREESLLLESPAYKEPSDISPDGRWLLFENRGDADYDLWVLELESGRDRPWIESPATERNGRFSPDGRWVAYQSDESGETEVYVRSFPAGDQRFVVSIGGGSAPMWRADGSELYYFSPRTSEITAVAIGWEGDRPLFGAPRALFRADIRDGVDVFPDGESFVLNRLAPPPEAGPLTLIQNWDPEGR